jgi:hypothetical protein
VTSSRGTRGPRRSPPRVSRRCARRKRAASWRAGRWLSRVISG